MDIYFGNLPAKMSAFELRRLVNKALSPKGFVGTAKSLFKPHERLKRLEFDIIAELKLGRELRYGKAIIEPDVVAKRVIEHIDQKFSRGKKLIVREYKSRSYSNDNRSIGWRNSGWMENERRLNERRVATLSKIKNKQT